MGLSTAPAVKGATVGPGPSLSGFADMRRRLRAIFVGSVGNLIECYDFYIYAAFSLYFAKSFFPERQPRRAATQRRDAVSRSASSSVRWAAG